MLAIYDDNLGPKFISQFSRPRFVYMHIKSKLNHIRNFNMINLNINDRIFGSMPLNQTDIIKVYVFVINLFSMSIL